MTSAVKLRSFRATPQTPREWNTFFRENFNILDSYKVADLPSPAPAGQQAYVSNESGGAVPAFSDGTNWRRCTDRAIVT